MSQVIHEALAHSILLGVFLGASSHHSIFTSLITTPYKPLRFPPPPPINKNLICFLDGVFIYLEVAKIELLACGLLTGYEYVAKHMDVRERPDSRHLHQYDAVPYRLLRARTASFFAEIQFSLSVSFNQKPNQYHQDMFFIHLMAS